MKKNEKPKEDYSILITDSNLLSKYNHNQLNVLGYLQFKRDYYTDYRATHNDFFYVTIDEIRNKTGIKSRDTITLYNRLFIQDKVIDFKSGNKHHPNHYRLNWDIELVDLHNEEADYNKKASQSDTRIKNKEVEKKNKENKYKEKGKSIEKRGLYKKKQEYKNKEKEKSVEKKGLYKKKQQEHKNKENGKSIEKKEWDKKEKSIVEANKRRGCFLQEIDATTNKNNINVPSDYSEGSLLFSSQSDTYSLEQTVSGYVEDFLNSSHEACKHKFFISLAKTIKHLQSNKHSVQYLFNNLQYLIDSLDPECRLYKQLTEEYDYLCKMYQFNSKASYTPPYVS